MINGAHVVVYSKDAEADCAHAVKAGLAFRPYSETVVDRLRWHKTQDEGGRTKLAGPSAAKEAELLAAWKVTRKP